jgi:hypothetical protein
MQTPKIKEKNISCDDYTTSHSKKNGLRLSFGISSSSFEIFAVQKFNLFLTTGEQKFTLLGFQGKCTMAEHQAE